MVKIREEWCKGCGLCLLNCPKKALSKSGRFNGSGYETVQVDEQLCIQCGICYTVCPDWVFEVTQKG